LQPFVTGSRAYGMPRPDSDVDLVALVTEADLAILLQLADNGKAIQEHAGDYDDHSDVRHERIVPLRFGKLNLLCTIYPEVAGAWRAATERLRSTRQTLSGYSRVDAVGYLQKVFAALGVTLGDDMADQLPGDVLAWPPTTPATCPVTQKPRVPLAFPIPAVAESPADHKYNDAPRDIQF